MADKRAIPLGADFILNGQQLVVAPLFYFLRDVVFPFFRGFVTGTFGIFKDKTILKARVANELDGLLKLFFRLAAEPNDKVAGNRGAGDR